MQDSIPIGNFDVKMTRRNEHCLQFKYSNIEKQWAKNLSNSNEKLFKYQNSEDKKKLSDLISTTKEIPTLHARVHLRT